MDMARKYSIAEMDRMRQAIKARMTASARGGREVATFSSNPAPRKRIEDQLCTHMANGTDPQELIDAALAAGSCSGSSKAQ